MRARAFLAAVVLVGAVGLSLRADDPKKSDPKTDQKADPKTDPKAVEAIKTELDKRLAKAAFDTIDLGYKLYSTGNHEGCYRVYQGGLIALLPMLDHRPKLGVFVREKMDKAALQKPAEGAITLREALDEIQKETISAAIPPKKALWDRLGGEAAVRPVVKDFLAEATKDPKLDWTRGGKYKIDDKVRGEIETALVELVSEWTGGPAKPTIPNLRAYLPGTKITSEEFDLAMLHLFRAMEKHKVSKDDANEVIQVMKQIKPYIIGQ